MPNLDYEFHMTDGNFAEFVKLIREQGGAIDAKRIELDGLTSGYAYGNSGNLKLHFNLETDQHHDAKEHLLFIVELSRSIGYNVLSWPPQPPVEPEQPIEDESVLALEEPPATHLIEGLTEPVFVPATVAVEDISAANPNFHTTNRVIEPEDVTPEPHVVEVAE